MNDLTNYMIEDVDGYDDDAMEALTDDEKRYARKAGKMMGKYDNLNLDSKRDHSDRLSKIDKAITDKVMSSRNPSKWKDHEDALAAHRIASDAKTKEARQSIDRHKKAMGLEDVDGYDEFDRLVDEAIEEAEYYNETGDDIDALLESIEGDYDMATEEFSANTKTVASTQSMINAGYSKDKAIKHMTTLIDYLRKHNMLAINIENVDENTVLTRKHLAGDGISFIKKYYEKFDGIKSAENDKLKGKLDSALKEYAKNQSKINDVVNVISLAIGGCGLFSIPLLIAYFGFGGSKRFINKTFNLDENTAVEDADYDDEIIDDDLMFDDDDDFDDDYIDSSTESALFLDFMLESCDSIEEFEELVNENATDWQLYGLIDDRDMALEASRIMKVENWKQKNRFRLIRRECIRIGKEKNDPNYIKYKKYRDLMRQFRQKLFDRYETLATRNVKSAHKNSVAKASNVKTASGKNTLTRLGVDSHATSQANSQMSKAKSGTGITAAHTKSKKKMA